MALFKESVNKEELAKVAVDLVEMLAQLKGENSSARAALERGGKIYDRAINKEIENPLKKGFFPEEFWETGGLFKYAALVEKAAEFSLLLEGAESVKGIRDRVAQIESSSDADEAALVKRETK